MVVMTNDYENGGLKMINIESQFSSLKGCLNHDLFKHFPQLNKIPKFDQNFVICFNRANTARLSCLTLGFGGNWHFTYKHVANKEFVLFNKNWSWCKEGFVGRWTRPAWQTREPHVMGSKVKAIIGHGRTPQNWSKLYYAIDNK